MGERDLYYEKRDNEIIFSLSDDVQASVKYVSPTKVEVQMWRGTEDTVAGTDLSECRHSPEDR